MARRLNEQSQQAALVLKGQALYALKRYEEAANILRQEQTRIHACRYLAASLARLGGMDEARHESRLFMTVNPGFRISYWAANQPFRDREILENIVDGYRKAGRCRAWSRPPSFARANDEGPVLRGTGPDRVLGA